MEVKTIDTNLLAKMFLYGAMRLDSKKEWINELNVFPVPDGDTGTNMTMTIMSAAKEVRSLENPSMEQLAKAISQGSLRGARGNSGVILSQLFRGFFKVLKEYDSLDVRIANDACQKAVTTAYKAVMKPKEGTILTVAKGAADKAAELVDETEDLVEYMDAIIKEADRILDLTPEMLPVLKEAGVVDSGGQGLMQVLKGAFDALTNKEVDYLEPADDEEKKAEKEEFKYNYCAEYLIRLAKPLTNKEDKEYKAYLESIGDSIVIVTDDSVVKTHLHTNDPGLALSKALSYGELSEVKIDNRKEKHEHKVISEEEQATGSVQKEEAQPVKEMPHKDMGVITVSIGDGINEIFRGLGVDYIIEGGQTMNPSTEDMLTAIEAVNADHIFILPNNKNIIMAANQAASLTENKEIIVIPTKTVPQGITALVNFIPTRSVEENKATMEEEIALVKTGQVTYAVRDTEIDGKTIKQDDYMGIGDKTILSVGKDMKETTLEMVDQMVDDDSAIISLYFGSDVKEEDAESLAEELREKYPDLEVEVNNGGQPIYYYVISIE